MTTDIAVRMTGIVKEFPGVRALDGVDFEIRRGVVTGLAGENGSGKSSLMKILAGRYRPDAGRVEIDGHAMSFTSPDEAAKAGIALVAQEISIHPALSVAENLFVGDLPRRRSGTLDHRRLRREAEQLLASVGLDVRPGTLLGALPLRTQQLVSILKMARRRPRVLVLDEPTSSLGEREVASLVALVGDLTASGTAVVYITHRLREYFDLCDTITVLRDGRVSAACEAVTDLDEASLVERMVGRHVDLSPRERAMALAADAVPRLEVQGLCVGQKLRDIDLTVAAGEVVGVAGQAGAGRSTLAKTLFGLKSHTGRILVDGQPVALRGPRSAMRAGIAYVPEDRRGAGVVLSMSIADNVTMTTWRRLSRFGLLSASGRRTEATRAIDAMGIRAPGPGALVRNLSGGNQQKVVIAKWMATRPRVLLLDEPTRGIDVGAKSEVYELIRRFTDQGLGVVCFSSELAELMHLCDRIIVLHRGAVAGELEAGAATEESITALAFGHGADDRLSSAGAERKAVAS